eukprot:15532452-Heterocapsa_arctica.AAC.1
MSKDIGQLLAGRATARSSRRKRPLASSSTRTERQPLAERATARSTRRKTRLASSSTRRERQLLFQATPTPTRCQTDDPPRAGKRLCRRRRE